MGSGKRIWYDTVIYDSPVKHWCSGYLSANGLLTESVGLGTKGTPMPTARKNWLFQHGNAFAHEALGLYKFVKDVVQVAFKLFPWPQTSIMSILFIMYETVWTVPLDTDLGWASSCFCPRHGPLPHRKAQTSCMSLYTESFIAAVQAGTMVCTLNKTSKFRGAP